MKRKFRALDTVVLSLLIILDLAVGLTVMGFETSGQTQNLPYAAVDEFVDLKYLAANMKQFEGVSVTTNGTVRYLASIYMYEDFWLQAQNSDAKIPVVTRLAGLAVPPSMAIVEVAGIVKHSTLEGGFYFLEASSWQALTSTSTPTPAPTSSPPPLPTPTPTYEPKPSVSIDLSCISSTSYASFKVTIAGRLKGSGVSAANLAGAPISLSYSITSGESWQDLALVYTDVDGVFGAVWTPSVTGSYLVKAAVANTTEYPEASTIVNLAVVPAAEVTDEYIQNVFSVASNSTVSNLAFNSASRRLTFSVEGLSGTTGFVDVNIAKTLINDITQVKAYLDDNEVAFTTVDKTDSWLLHFTYEHSLHEVMLSLAAESQPDFLNTPLGLIVVGGFVAMVIAVSVAFVLKRRRSLAN